MHTEQILNISSIEFDDGRTVSVTRGKQNEIGVYNRGYYQVTQCGVYNTKKHYYTTGNTVERKRAELSVFQTACMVHHAQQQYPRFSLAQTDEFNTSVSVIHDDLILTIWL